MLGLRSCLRSLSQPGAFQGGEMCAAFAKSAGVFCANDRQKRGDRPPRQRPKPVSYKRLQVKRTNPVSGEPVSRLGSRLLRSGEGAVESEAGIPGSHQAKGRRKIRASQWNLRHQTRFGDCITDGANQWRAPGFGNASTHASAAFQSVARSSFERVISMNLRVEKSRGCAKGRRQRRKDGYRCR